MDPIKCFYVTHLRKCMDESNYCFSIKLTYGKENENNFIIGMFGDNPSQNEFDASQFLNAIENTKNSFLYSLNKVLDFTKTEKIIPDGFSVVHDMFNPYSKDERYYYFENAVIRLGSLWDQLAHFCNIVYNLKIKVGKVDDNIFNSKNGEYLVNDRMKEINSYYLIEDSSNDIGVRKFVKKLRNMFIHYCDFNALKFYSKYLNEKNDVQGYPFGYYVIQVIRDYEKIMHFCKSIFQEYLNSLQ